MPKHQAKTSSAFFYFFFVCVRILSLLLDAIEAQWFRLRLELEARDVGDPPTHTVVGRH
jgi:hypothetical protein